MEPFTNGLNTRAYAYVFIKLIYAYADIERPQVQRGLAVKGLLDGGFFLFDFVFVDEILLGFGFEGIDEIVLVLA